MTPTGNQIELAIDILNTHSRAKARFKTLETGMEELRILTCENWEATDEEIEKAVEKIDTDLTLYGKKLFDIKIIHNKVLERCRCISVKSKPKKQDGGTRNKKNPTNLHENDQNCDKDVSKVEDPENEFPKWLLELDYTIKNQDEKDVNSKVKVENTMQSIIQYLQIIMIWCRTMRVPR